MLKNEKIEEIFNGDPAVPHDIYELKHITSLLEKIPLYQEKIEKLKEEIKNLSFLATNVPTKKDYIKPTPAEIQALIFRAFFIELENRKFNIPDTEAAVRERVEAYNFELIKNRNLSCEICGENRSIDRCHIIPAKLGGTARIDNILILCPTHHRLFDRFMLTKKEYASINWDKKSLPSIKYAETVTLETHRKFWELIEKKQFNKVPIYDIEEYYFVEYVCNEILSYFYYKKIINEENIYNTINPNLMKLTKNIIELLKKENVIISSCNQNNLIFLSNPNYKINKELALEIWKELE